MILIAFGRTEGAFTKTRIFHYYNLPVPKLLIKYQNIIIDTYLKSISSNDKNQFYNKLLDYLVYELYFFKDFKDLNIGILDDLKNDYDSVKNVDFNNLYKIEKINIIKSFI